MACWLGFAVISGSLAWTFFSSDLIDKFCLGIIFSLITIVCAMQTFIQYEIAKEFFDAADNKEKSRKSLGLQQRDKTKVVGNTPRR